MAESGLLVLWAAFKRIMAGKPLIVSVNDPLSYDLVCLEAGFKRGYLKAKRSQHDEIRAAIMEAMKKQPEKPKKMTKSSIRDAVKKKNADIAVLKTQYELVLNRQIMLIQHIYNLEKELRARTQPRLVYSQSD